MQKLVLVSAGPPERRIVVETLPAVIGREVSADIRADDSRVRGFHCVLDSEDETVFVLDLGTRNGTFVNGVRVGRAELRDGDTLTVGRITFVVHWEGGRER